MFSPPQPVRLCLFERCNREKNGFFFDGEIQMSEAELPKPASDIKGGKVSGPRVWMEAYCPFRPSHFHGTRHFVYTHFPKAVDNANRFTSPIRLVLPWEGPDCFQLAEDESKKTRDSATAYVFPPQTCPYRVSCLLEC